MKRILALAFVAVTAFGAAAAGSAEAAGRGGHSDRYDNRYEQRYDRGNEYRRNDGRLGGSWYRTCTDSHVRRGVLYADCKTRRGNWRQTSLRIDNCRSAENDNGRLVCTQKQPQRRR